MKLMIATPAYEAKCRIDHAHSLVGVCTALERFGHGYELYGYCDSLLTRGRSNAAIHLLNSDSDAILMLDGDVAIDPLGALELVNANLPFVGAFYRLKFPGPPQVIAIRNQEASEILYLGTGAVLIHRNVFEQLIAKLPELAAPPGIAGPEQTYNGKFYDFFGQVRDAETGCCLSEDYSLCAKWRGIGGTVHALPEVRTTHFDGMSAYSWPPEETNA